MLIAHVEQDGVWLVDGGMRGVAAALCGLARELGVDFRFGDGAAELLLDGGRISGARSDSGEQHRAAQVVFNGDVSALGSGLLGPGVRSAAW